MSNRFSNFIGFVKEVCFIEGCDEGPPSLPFPFNQAGFIGTYNAQLYDKYTFHALNYIASLAPQYGEVPLLLSQSDILCPFYVETPIKGAQLQDSGAVESILYTEEFPLSETWTVHAGFYVPDTIVTGSGIGLFAPGQNMEFVNNGSTFDLLVSGTLVAEDVPFGPQILILTLDANGDIGEAFLNTMDTETSFSAIPDFETSPYVGFHSPFDPLTFAQDVIFMSLSYFNVVHTNGVIADSLEYWVDYYNIGDGGDQFFSEAHSTFDFTADAEGFYTPPAGVFFSEAHSTFDFTADAEGTVDNPVIPARYWVGGTATWDGTDGSKWSLTSGGAGGAGRPTTSEDAIFNASSGSGNVTLSSSSVWKNMNMTGFTGTMTLPTSTTVAARGNVILEGSATYTAANTTTSIFDFSQAGTHYLNGDGASWAGRLQISGASTTLRLSGTITFNNINFTAGNFYTDGYALTTTGAFAAAGSTTRTLDITNSAISVQTWTLSGTNITLVSTGSHITNSATGNSTVTPGGYSYNIMTLPTNSSIAITATLGAGSFVELRVPGDTLNLSGNITATTLTTLGGNISRSNLIMSSVAGTARTITSGTVSVTGRLLLQDITGAGGGWNLSSVESGDCGRNTGITFTAPVTGYWMSPGGTQSAYNASFWASTSGGSGGTAARIPSLPQDTMMFNASSPSGQISFATADNHLGGLDFTGFNGSNCAFANCTIYGSFIAPSGSVVFTGNPTLNFDGRDAGNTFSCGVTLGGSGAKSFSGYWTFGDNYVGTGDFTISAAPCDIDLAGYDISCGGNFSIAASSLINIDLYGSTITPVTTPSGATNGGINIGTLANIGWDNTTTFAWTQPSTARAITFNGRTVPANVTLTLGAGTLTYNGGGTYNANFIVTGVGQIRFQNNSTMTFGATGTHSFTGTSGNLVDINRVSSGVVNMVKTTGSVTFDYCTIANVTASGGASFTATNCTDGGGNTGINFI